MRLAFKFTLALLLGLCAVLAVYGYIRAQREIAVFESDMRHDHHAMGQALALAVGKLWDVGGQKAALEFVAQANHEKAQVNIRWVALDAEATQHERPRLARELLEPLSRGEEVTRVYRDQGGGNMYTYIPVTQPDRRPGAVELIESLADERKFILNTIARISLTTLVVALVFGLIAMALGVWLVGRPVGQLVEKARRVGAGDLSGPLMVHPRDEFADLARALNAMCDRLAEANLRVAAETAARIATLEQLRHADRLMTVGKLASGIAHELGTPLNVVQARAGMMAAGEVEGPEVPAFARVIVGQCERMTRIIRQLLDFARPRSPRTAPVDLGQVARQTLNLLAPMAEKRGVRLEMLPIDQPAMANVDADQMLQVLSNLVLNGIQAMAEGGLLTVGIEHRTARPANSPTATMGRYVRMFVQDRGVGIDAEHLPHVFEPFFTTKAVGEGTGLGLSVSLGIVREHRGWIDVESSAGQGACFSVYLPEGVNG